jgi:hypothetical protein
MPEETDGNSTLRSHASPAVFEGAALNQLLAKIKLLHARDV